MKGRVTEVRVKPTANGFTLTAYRKVARGTVRMGNVLSVVAGDQASSDTHIEAWYKTVNPPKPEVPPLED